MNLGEMAESIMMQGAPKPVAQEYSNPVHAPEDSFGNQLDISDVQVPDSFVQKMIGESTEPQAEKEPVEAQHTNSDILSVLYEEIQELKNMVSEMKELLTEQSTVGGLGVNMAGKCADPTKDEDDAWYRRNRIKKALQKAANK